MMVSLIGNHDTIRSVWPESGGLSLDLPEDDGILVLTDLKPPSI